MSNKGRRYDTEARLNYKKVIAVIIAIIVIFMFVAIIKSVVTPRSESERTISVDYYTLYSEESNLWGVLGTNGEIIIEPIYKNMLIVINNSKDVFLCVYDENENGEYKTKAIDKNNKEIFTEYDKVEALENYDSAGNLWYEKNIIRVEKNGKYGLINLEGKEILGTQYDSIETVKGIENSLLVKKDELYGVINTSGATIVQPEYSKIEVLGDTNKKSYITINSDGKYGLISAAGTTILNNEYEKIDNIYGEKYFVVEVSGKQKLINEKGEDILTKNFDKITQINTEGVVFSKNNKYGFINYEGNIVIPAEYEELKEINTKILMAKKDGKVGLIDLEKNEKIPFLYEDIYYADKIGLYIAEDLQYNSSIIDTNFEVKLTGIISEINVDNSYIIMKINGEDKYFNFKLEEKDKAEILKNRTLFVAKQNEKYGYVDKDGKTVVDYIYDEAKEQNSYGYCAVKKDGVWGSIDEKGNVVIEPKYNLDNNLVIDFIGKWHYGKDLNMNYYCQK